MKYSVTFLPDNITVEVERGTSLLHAASFAEINLKSSCGGAGTCGRCKVKVDTGYLLACKTLINDHMTAEIPDDTRLDEHKVLLSEKEGLLTAPRGVTLTDYPHVPLSRKIRVSIEAPSINENSSDFSRLQAEIAKQVGLKSLTISLPVLKGLAESLRKDTWNVTITLTYNGSNLEITSCEPGHSLTSCYGIAVDIGTTTVAASLVDLEKGISIDKVGTYNRQARLGDDVISRIIHGSDEKGLQELQKLIINTINELIDKLLSKWNMQSGDISVMVTSGNTTMSHLFLGLNPKYIRLEPYVPTANIFPVVKAKELGLAINPNGLIFSFPAVASYVGGDIVSGVLATMISKREELTLFIDIGTNGEIVLGNQEWLISCACSAGPAFEGGGITFGTRAMKGAIEKIDINPSTFETRVETIEGAKAIGICGSGLIDCISKMYSVGIIDRTGSFQDVSSSRVKRNENDKLFVLVWAKDSGLDKDIYITENDIKNLIRSKGAVFAGIESLLKTVQLDFNVVDKILIAGGFGNYLNVYDAIKIGLLPDLPMEKFKFVGNTSLRGSEIALLSQDAWKQAEIIGKMMTYIELSVGNLFMDEFTKALFLPHTDLTLFPSVK
ncbi:MAG: ASKHA domain-containing protein [Bacillota bacterium]